MESYVIQLAVNKREGFSIEFVSQQKLLEPETMERDAEQLKSLLFDSLPSYTMDQLRDKINDYYSQHDKVRELHFQEVLRMLVGDDDIVAEWAQQKDELDGWFHIDQGLPDDGEYVLVYDHVDDLSGYGVHNSTVGKWHVSFGSDRRSGDTYGIVSHWKDFPDVTGLQRYH